MKEPLVSIIVLNLNGKKYLEKCLASLEKQIYVKTEFVIVDNGSIDDSVVWIKKNFFEARLIENKINLGFARACNQGSQIARGKYLFFLNNDAVLEKSCLQKLVLFMGKNKQADLVGPAVYEKDKIGIESAGLVPTLTGFFYNLPLKTKKPFETFGVTGAAMMVRKNVFEKMGGFDADFFVYSEDVDLCTRMRIAGAKIYVLPEAKVFHQRGQTSQKFDKSLIVYQATKNRILLLLKNFSLPLLIVMLIIHLFFLFLGVLLFLFSGKKKEAGAIVKGVWWNVKRTSLTLRKRKKVQCLRQISDWQLFREYFEAFPIKAFIKTGQDYIKFW